MTQRILLNDRSYVAVAPPTAAPWPVVLMLHGAGGTAEWTLEETYLADEVRRGFLLLLPEATRPYPQSPPSFLSNPQVWNDGLQDGQPPRPVLDDVAFLDTVLNDATNRFPIDPHRVFLMGFSNGAAMTFRYASERSDRLRAIAPIAGYCTIDPTPTRPLPTVYLVGTRDPLVPINGGPIVTPWGRTSVLRPSVPETLQKWARAIGCSSSPLKLGGVPGVTFYEYPGATRFFAYFLEGHGHHWPGGRGSLPERIAGPSNDQFDAFELIWSFFEEQLGN